MILVGGKTKILHLYAAFEDDGPGKGIFALAKYLDNSKFEVDLCSMYQPSFDTLVKRIQAESLGYACLNMRGFGDASVAVKLARLVRANKYQIVHSHGARADWYAALIRLLFPKVVFLSTARGTYDEEYRLRYSKLVSTISIWIYKLAHRAFDCSIALSQAVHDYLRRQRVPESRIVDILNAVDLEGSSMVTPGRNTRSDIGVGKHELAVICVGSLIERKGLSYLIDAIAPLITDGLPIRLILVGDGPCKEALQSQARDAGILPNIVFLGHRTDIPDLLAAADLFVMPSLSEGLPRAMMEGMVLGLPCVGTDLPGIQQLITHGETGLIVPKQNSSALRAALLELATNAGRRLEMGRRGRERIRTHFDARTMAAAHAALYDKLLTVR